MKIINNKLISIFAVCLALLLFVGAVGYNVVYTDINNAAFFNQTEKNRRKIFKCNGLYDN